MHAAIKNGYSVCAGLARSVAALPAPGALHRCRVPETGDPGHML